MDRLMDDIWAGYNKLATAANVTVNLWWRGAVENIFGKEKSVSAIGAIPGMTRNWLERLGEV
jgi:hypothetical protein